MRTVLLVGFDSALHQSVSGIALHKVCGFRPATEHVFCLDWLVALYFCEFTRQQFPPEKVHLQISGPGRHERHHTGSNEMSKQRCSCVTALIMRNPL